jgi:CheY-like chemotaxis protein
MTSTENHSLHVVLVDEDDVDAEAVARLLRRHHLPYRLTVFSDGRIAQLALAGAFGRELLAEPYLILLDLNMPRMNGFEFLDWLHSEPDFQHAMVFIFSTSDDPNDGCQASRRPIAGYLAKSKLGPDYAGLLPVLAAGRLALPAAPADAGSAGA